MKKYRLITLFLALGFGAFVSAESKVEENIGRATLTVQREGIVSKMNYRLYIDREFIGRLKTAREVSMDLTPGQYVVWANDARRSRLAVTLADDSSAVVSVSIDRNGVLNLVQLEDRTEQLVKR